MPKLNFFSEGDSFCVVSSGALYNETRGYFAFISKGRVVFKRESDGATTLVKYSDGGVATRTILNHKGRPIEKIIALKFSHYIRILYYSNGRVKRISFMRNGRNSSPYEDPESSPTEITYKKAGETNHLIYRDAKGRILMKVRSQTRVLNVIDKEKGGLSRMVYTRRITTKIPGKGWNTLIFDGKENNLVTSFDQGRDGDWNIVEKRYTNTGRVFEIISTTKGSGIGIFWGGKGKHMYELQKVFLAHKNISRKIVPFSDAMKKRDVRKERR